MTEPIRKLAAIVFTDIVGFTKLTAEDQSKASALLKQQRELFRPIVDSYKGMWVKEMGDGLLLTFDTVTDAVNCCIKLQGASKQIDNLDLRIGIHQGEILIEENDIIGDDVNVAARIEPFSAPGGIAISNKVHDAIVRESDYTTKYLGKPKLKGVGQEVKVFCITSHDLSETKLSDVSAKLEPEGFQWNVMNSLGVAASMIGLFMLINFMFLRIGFADEEGVPSIAILPLDNKGDEDDEFYAYGISSDLISDVASAGLIRVASLNRIEELGDISAQEKAKKLDVRYIAEGTLWKRDSIFQLSMELYDTKSEKVVWSERWQKNWSDFPSIGDVLSENILEILKVEQRSGVQKIALNPDAYEFYLKGKHKYEKREYAEETEIARGLLKKAIELDENLIAAQHLLGSTYSGIGDWDKVFEIYSSSLKRAEQLGDEMWIGRSIRKIGNSFYGKGDQDKALENWEKSLAIAEEIGDKSGMSGSLNNIGLVHHDQKDYDKSLEYHSRSLIINEELGDKSSIASNLSNIGLVHHQRRETEKAFGYLKRSLAINEEIGNKTATSNILRKLALIYKDKGNYDKALHYTIRSLQNYGDLGYGVAELSAMEWIGWAYFTMGIYDQSIDYYEKRLSVDNESSNKEWIAFIYGKLGFSYFYAENYVKALENFEMSTQIALEAINEEMLHVKIYRALTKKQLGKVYDISEILKIDKIEEKVRNYYLDQFGLYKLLGDRVYLENAFNDIQEKAGRMEDEFKQKYLNYQVQKQIIEEYNKVFS
ncbi:MAG: tetratricopeptide repeat protein [Candidatus Marinimicrobia bacterium]|jgi:class 3 adenylate cyclase/tetratricopeptide (TPR) repeat protein|nr:tetratricopeptide repeat protein [Candidatus Neomarinimicrobiota bacterium]MBT6711000.1 tetratricopeptide repeat protein [Candidatus Neomarinimicrobiota bacterium]MBT7372660.1 tetratricopeptide repeat protein [Candidatus Neomarinimicrobiota bacterium]